MGFLGGWVVVMTRTYQRGPDFGKDEIAGNASGSERRDPHEMLPLCTMSASCQSTLAAPQEYPYAAGGLRLNRVGPDRPRRFRTPSS